MVKDIIIKATVSTTALLEEHIAVLKAVADELLEKETITLDDIDRIIREQNGEAAGGTEANETVADAEERKDHSADA